MPTSAGSAASLDDALDNLKNKINSRVAGEEWDNRVVMDKVEDVERLLEMEFARMAADPRTSSKRTPKLRELLDRMFDRTS